MVMVRGNNGDDEDGNDGRDDDEYIDCGGYI